MARSNPIGKIKDTALGTIKGSVTTTQDVVGQAVDKARDTVETVTALVPGRKSAPKKSGTTGKSRAARVPAVEADSSRKVQGDPLAPAATKATKRTPAKKTPAKKTASEKAAATKAPAEKTPAKKTPAKKTPAKKTPAKKAPAKKGATTATPADVAKKSAKKAPAKKPASKKTAPAKRAASTTAAAKKTSPAVEAETVYSTSSEDAHPKATQGSSSDAPLIDPGTAKATLTEAQTLSRAADPDKG